MTLATGSLAVVDDLFDYAQYNRFLTHFRSATAPANAQPGSIFSDSDDDRLYHAGAASAQEEILQLTRSKAAAPQFAELRLMDTNASHYLGLKWNEDRAAHQTLNIITGAADRTITLAGNTTLDQDLRVTDGPTFAHLHLNGPDAGLYLCRSGVDEPFIYLSTDTALSGGQIRAINAGGLKFTHSDGATIWMTVTANTNVGFGTADFGTSAVKVVAVGTGTAPTTAGGDNFQMYSKDIAAGEAAPHFMTEHGDVIRLYQQAHVGNPAGGATVDAEARSAINSILTIFENNGLMARA